MSRISGIIAGLAMVATVPASAGPFTKAQAEAGHLLFNNNCAQCHHPRLKGALGPSLIDDKFKQHWEGKPVSDLRSFIYNNMPQNAPKSLDDDMLDPIVAWILINNDIKPGDKELTKTSASADFPKK